MNIALWEGTVNKFRKSHTYSHTGVHQKAPILAIEGDMGWIRTKVRQWVAMLRVWNKLIQMPDNCLTKKVFTWDYDFYVKILR